MHLEADGTQPGSIGHGGDHQVIRRAGAAHAVGERHPGKRVVLRVRGGHPGPAWDLGIRDRIGDPARVGLRRRAQAHDTVAQSLAREGDRAAPVAIRQVPASRAPAVRRRPSRCLPGRPPRPAARRPRRVSRRGGSAAAAGDSACASSAAGGVTGGLGGAAFTGASIIVMFRPSWFGSCSIVAELRNLVRRASAAAPRRARGAPARGRGT